MNTKEIVILGLGLEHPWKLLDVSFEVKDDNKVLIIDVGFERGHKFIDLDSGQAGGVHDTIGRSWRHLNLFQHECKVPHIRTPEGNVRQVLVPWSRPGSGFTLLFEAYSMLLVESEMLVNKVGKVVGEYPKRIWTIFNY